MRRNVWSLLVAVMGVIALALGSQPAGAQGKRTGKVVRSYREDRGGGRPAWVTQALQRGWAHLLEHGSQQGIQVPAVELVLLSADEDDLGQTHLRLDQVHNGVPVFGGQLVTHLDAKAVRHVGGRFFPDARIDTTPRIDAAQALKAAKEALGYKGNFANQPEARLVVLPRPDGKPGATLTYQVTLLVEDGTAWTGRYEYFIDAVDRSVTWFYNNMHSGPANGTGNSLYSGQVNISTNSSGGTYYLLDASRSAMMTYTMRNAQSGGYALSDTDNVWGNGANNDEDSAGVDAHFGAAQTWDYFLSVHGRRGIDGSGYRLLSRVHYGNNYNNAFWNGFLMTYGDGDGVTFSPLVSLDVVGHEITHGLTQKTAGLIYFKESGAANESFSDIFGTAVEFHADDAGTDDYLIGEDIYTPGTAGDALRSMDDPTTQGDPDHYANRDYPDCWFPLPSNDSCGVHSNSGIQNKAFYLLAEGGTHPVSGITVTGIGRDAAERIFFRALTLYLSPWATFHYVYIATLFAAYDLYGLNSAEFNATQAAWNAVGVH